MLDPGGLNPPQQPPIAAPAPSQAQPPAARKRRRLLRAAALTALALASAGTWVGCNLTELRAKFAARQLASATTDEARARWADALIGCGHSGVVELAEFVKSAEEPTRSAAAAALDKHLRALPEGDPRAVTISGTLLDAFPAATEAGKLAFLRLVPTILKQTGGTHALRCRGLVVEGLKSADFESQLTAVQLSMHPDIKLRAELVPLLCSPEPRLRGAALFAVAAAGEGEPILGDEELFRWLHDGDANVRRICHDALAARDRSESEIALGRRLTDPDPTERLKLLLDLRYDNEVADPEPWLERLGRDPEPAVRAGAARVAVEIALAHAQRYPQWVARIADADPHPTVRFVAAYYRAQPARAPELVRPVTGP